MFITQKLQSYWRFPFGNLVDLCANKRRTLDLEQLVNLATDGHDTLERHVARRTVCANECFLVVDGEHAVLDRRTNEAVRLTIPMDTRLSASRSGYLEPMRTPRLTSSPDAA